MKLKVVTSLEKLRVCTLLGSLLVLTLGRDLIFKTLKITAECEYKKRTKKSTRRVINNAIYKNRDFTQWQNFEKEIYEGYGYDLVSRVKKYSD